MYPSKLESGRLIPAGNNCPFSEFCPTAKRCNRPKNMGTSFACDSARFFDRLQMGGSLAQAATVDGWWKAPGVSSEKEDIISLFGVTDDSELINTTAKIRHNGATGGYHKQKSGARAGK